MRIARITTPGAVHHVICRFVDREWFFREDEERTLYLRLLGRAMKDSDWLCLAYALMSNHIHISLVAGQSPLEAWARRVHSPFARWMNTRYGRIGPMFAHRPDSPEIQPHDEGRVIAYIHNNPVNAKVVDRARDSRWTSHAAYVGDVEAPSWLRCAEGLARAGFPEAPDKFDEWVNNQVGIEMPELELEPVARALRRRGALEIATPTLGSDAIPVVARPFGRIRPDPREVVTVASQVLGVALPMLCSKQREFTDARRVVVHSARLVGLTGSDIAAVLGVSQQAVSKIALDRLEGRLHGVRDVIVDRLLARKL